MQDQLSKTDGYCCADAYKINGGPLCSLIGKSEQGCFLKEQSVKTNTPPNTPFALCTNPKENECVIDGSSEPLKITSTENLASEKDLILTEESYGEVVCQATGISEVVETYYVMPEGCTYEDTNNCYPVTHYSCGGVSGCQAMCDEYDEASGEWIDCIEVCDEYDCTEFTTYHGPICTFKEGCNPIEEISILQSVFYNTHGCTTPCYEKPIKDPLSKEPINSPSEIIQTGIGDKCPDYHTALLEYTEHTFETTLEDEVYCMPEGTQLELSDGAMIECYDVAAQQFGDYWCPENYYYDELLGLCTQSTEICDQGFSGGLEHGCDTPYNPLNDTIWTQYQSDCVDQSASAPKELYDTMCCYDSVFNGFEIYQWGKEETHVKVY